MSDITKILDAVAAGDPQAAGQLLPLVYDELRRLATRQLRQEKPGHTLQATALVHEAYLRLVGKDGLEPNWDSRGHFFAAAAQAMRRILVEKARRKKRRKRGGDLTRQELDESQILTGRRARFWKARPSSKWRPALCSIPRCATSTSWASIMWIRND